MVKKTCSRYGYVTCDIKLLKIAVISRDLNSVKRSAWAIHFIGFNVRAAPLIYVIGMTQ